MTRRTGLLAIAALAALALTPALAKANPPCGSLILTSITLDEEMYCNNPGPALTVSGSPGATLDLGGHEVRDYSTTTEPVIRVTGAGAKVTNGRVVWDPSFCPISSNVPCQGAIITGVEIAAADVRVKAVKVEARRGIYVPADRSGARIQNGVVQGGGIEVRGDNALISGEAVYGSAIKLFDVIGATLSENTVLGTPDEPNDGHTSAGIELTDSDSSTVQANTVCRSEGYGIGIAGDSDGNTIAYNELCGNGAGIAASGSPSSSPTHNRLIGNIATGNGSGIGLAIDGGSGWKVNGNRASHNLFDGIYVLAGVGATLKNNTANSNGYHGFFVQSSQVTNAGGNRAKGNYLAQCVGISCN